MSQTLVELKKLAKSKGHKNYSKLNKAALEKLLGIQVPIKVKRAPVTTRLPMRAMKQRTAELLAEIDKELASRRAPQTQVGNESGLDSHVPNVKIAQMPINPAPVTQVPRPHLVDVAISERSGTVSSSNLPSAASSSVDLSRGTESSSHSAVSLSTAPTKSRDPEYDFLRTKSKSKSKSKSRDSKGNRWSDYDVTGGSLGSGSADTLATNENAVQFTGGPIGGSDVPVYRQQADVYSGAANFPMQPFGALVANSENNESNDPQNGGNQEQTAQNPDRRNRYVRIGNGADQASYPSDSYSSMIPQMLTSPLINEYARDSNFYKRTGYHV